METSAPSPARPLAADRTCEPPCGQDLDGHAATPVAAALKALADPLRVRIVSLIATSPTGEASAPDMVAAHEPRPETPGLTEVHHALERIAARLAARCPALGADLVSQTVRESYAALARGAGGRSHLVATVERFARQRLADLPPSPVVPTG